MHASENQVWGLRNIPMIKKIGGSRVWKRALGWETLRVKDFLHAAYYQEQIITFIYNDNYIRREIVGLGG